MQAQQVLVSATQFIIDLNKCIATRTNFHYIYERMQQLDAWASSALAQSNLLPVIPQSANCGDDMEYITSQSIRAISRIKLSRCVATNNPSRTLLTSSSAQIKTHRFRAFSDIPIFIKKHCDLTAANAVSADAPKDPSKAQAGISNIGCGCGGLESFQQQQPSCEFTPSSTSASSTSSDYQSMSQYSFTSGFPYSPQHSAKVCLRAALLISRMFASLPLPQPVYDGNKNQHLLRQQVQLPRTMPSFACCLMQGSYAMLMIYYKARVEKQLSSDAGSKDANDPSTRLIEELRQGLERIIATVSNYAIAFEALDGMRGMPCLTVVACKCIY